MSEYSYEWIECYTKHLLDHPGEYYQTRKLEQGARYAWVELNYAQLAEERGEYDWTYALEEEAMGCWSYNVKPYLEKEARAIYEAGSAYKYFSKMPEVKFFARCDVSDSVSAELRDMHLRVNTARAEYRAAVLEIEQHYKLDWARDKVEERSESWKRKIAIASTKKGCVDYAAARYSADKARLKLDDAKDKLMACRTEVREVIEHELKPKHDALVELECNLVHATAQKKKEMRERVIAETHQKYIRLVEERDARISREREEFSAFWRGYNERKAAHFRAKACIVELKESE